MKISVELYGAARDFSKSNNLEFDFIKNCKIEDIKNKLNEYIDKNFAGNKNYKEIIKSSAFCSENDQLIRENQILGKNQTIGIIPPIGGG
jgi:molybdopterin converting factor small subunit